MNDKQLLIAIVLDRSGSMEPIWNATTEAFNGFVVEQSKNFDKSEAWVSLTIFDDAIDMPYLAWDIKDFPELTNTVATPRGATALFDAIGETIDCTDKWMKDNAWFDGKVMLVIQTDGHENASTKFEREAIVSKIREKEAAGWGLLYLGANQDAWDAASFMGFSNRGQTISYAGTIGGTQSMAHSASQTTLDYMRTGKVDTGDAADQR